jgi:hypothetical protein
VPDEGKVEVKTVTLPDGSKELVEVHQVDGAPGVRRLTETGEAFYERLEVIRLIVRENRNERWQADITHWRAPDRAPVEILNILDDHSRLLVGLRRQGGDLSPSRLRMPVGPVRESAPSEVGARSPPPGRYNQQDGRVERGSPALRPGFLPVPALEGLAGNPKLAGSSGCARASGNGIGGFGNGFSSQPPRYWLWGTD